MALGFRFTPPPPICGGLFASDRLAFASDGPARAVVTIAPGPAICSLACARLRRLVPYARCSQEATLCSVYMHLQRLELASNQLVGGFPDSCFSSNAADSGRLDHIDIANNTFFGRFPVDTLLRSSLRTFLLDLNYFE
eukprot:129734-Prymnesium_polylepis.1